MKKNIRLLFAAAAAALIGILALSLAGYEASESAEAAMARGQTQGCVTAFGQADSQTALIFYPGGMVDHAAYAPLMEEIAGQGAPCLLVQMPLDLAVLDMNAAKNIREAYPDVQRWFIGGHSLGGAMAASYAAKHAKDFEGLVLLGAYSTADLSGTDMRVLSLYGSQDGVLNRKKYADCLANYPQRFSEIVIEGGNHAGFGDYGAQKGDGIASIPPEEQSRLAAQAIGRLITE